MEFIRIPDVTNFDGEFQNNIEDAKEETWADLPPNQRRKKIQKKLNEIREELAHETSQKDGLQRMKRTYEENSALGDPAAIDPEIDRCNKLIDNYHQQVQRSVFRVDSLHDHYCYSIYLKCIISMEWLFIW